MTWESWRLEVNRRARDAGWAFRENFTDAHESECLSLWRQGKSPDDLFARTAE